MSHRRWAVLLACLTLMTGGLGCGGCGSEEPAPPAKKRQASKDSAADAQDDTTMARMRRVYGLPLPPSVMRIDRSSDRVRVKTDMSLEEVSSFFEARLTDYEVLHPPNQVRIVGLRDYMPEIYAYPFGPRTFVVYLPANHRPDQKPAQADNKAAETGSSKAKAEATKPTPTHHVKGQPVLDRTADGELLAPGARWGEPYTPPKGTPLHNKHFRSNFGRPYGQWSLQ